MATKDSDSHSFQERKDLQGVIIPAFKLEEKDDLTEDSKPCHKEALASLHCKTWRKPEECDEVVENYKRCSHFWKIIVKERTKKGIHPALPPVNERQKVLEEHQNLIQDKKPYYERPM